jgi:hypothetical protein
VKSLITARWKKRRAVAGKVLQLEPRRASGAASTAGELISGSPCRSDGLANGCGNSEQDLCVLAIVGTRLTRMLGPSCRHSGSARRSGGLASGRGEPRAGAGACACLREQERD